MCCGRIGLVEGSIYRRQRGTRRVRVCRDVTAVFGDPNLVSCAGQVPVLALAQRGGLPRLVAEHVHPGGAGGVNAHLKIPSLVAGMGGRR